MKVYSIDNLPQDHCVRNSVIAIAKDNECYFENVHTHNYYEIEYVYEGSGVQIINNRTFHVKAGDLIFFQKNDFHSYYSIQDMKVINCCFNDQGNINVEYNQKFGSNSVVINLTPDAIVEIEKLLNCLELELSLKRDNCDKAAKCYIELMIIFLMRNGYSQRNPSSTWDPLLSLIFSNHASITLQEASDFLRVSKNYFCRLFKAEFGVTFKEYVTNVKIQSAKQMLISTDKSISIICEETGFLQAKQFYAEFKEHTGITPLVYRKTMRGSINI